MEISHEFPRLTRYLRTFTDLEPRNRVDFISRYNGFTGDTEKTLESDWIKLVNVIEANKCLNESVSQKLNFFKEAVKQITGNKGYAFDPQFFMFSLFLYNEQALKKLAVSLKNVFENVTLRKMKELNMMVRDLYCALSPDCQKEVNKLLKESSDINFHNGGKIIYNVDIFWLVNELKTRCSSLFKDTFTMADCVSLIVLKLASIDNSTILQKDLEELLGIKNAALVEMIIQRKHVFLKDDILLGARQYRSQRMVNAHEDKPFSLTDEVEIIRLKSTDKTDQKTLKNDNKEKCQAQSERKEIQKMTKGNKSCLSNIPESISRNITEVGESVIIRNPLFNPCTFHTNFDLNANNGTVEQKEKETEVKNAKTKRKQKKSVKAQEIVSKNTSDGTKVNNTADEFAVFGETLANFLRSQKNKNKVDYIKGKIAELILETF
ncbi:uncharacterized protein LOC106662917 isoform X2 [Cimex lectularius]|uniref:Uncharacterized protein n=1 Tax=Cimex lectularius TaxID=79782 RepID=A0A8I6RBR8_CIMLE|nr:uncharacterized protein LOC106662917 isoform X2 [Cimex lectularius]